MKLSDLQTKLLRAARQSPPAASVPYAFEKRIMHRLSARQPDSALAMWGAALWRGAIACVALTLLCGVWSYAAQKRQIDAANDFSQELQSTVFASMDQQGEVDW